ncbi:MAG: GNAT family N-acetyltransferase [Myxococcales bacterium]|nr:GNAT family N-acetyltransferase [Myxococcales bacterium]
MLRMAGERAEPTSEAALAPFSEREFYAREFRGRTLAIGAPDPGGAGAESLPLVVEALRLAGARSVVVVPAGAKLGWEAPRLSASHPRLEAEVWRALRSGGQVVVEVDPESGFFAESRGVVVRLGIFKLVWLDAGGGLGGPGDRRQSFVQQDELAARVRSEGDTRAGLWAEVQAAVAAGVAAVNVCTPAGLEDELFTYAGSGTLVTRERYIEVRRLGIDDFDAAHDLVARGVAEGYLAPRTPDQLDEVLAQGFGAFVEHAHLAGIGALLGRWGPGVGEIGCLYTLTRFLGEGVGGHLVSFALEEARAADMTRVFACTTQERVGAFFERLGFARVETDAVPAARWDGYDPTRLARVRCFEWRP